MLVSGCYEVPVGVALGVILLVLAASVGLLVRLPENNTHEDTEL